MQVKKSATNHRMFLHFEIYYYLCECKVCFCIYKKPCDSRAVEIRSLCSPMWLQYKQIVCNERKQDEKYSHSHDRRGKG